MTQLNIIEIFFRDILKVLYLELELLNISFEEILRKDLKMLTDILETCCVHLNYSSDQTTKKIDL
jgi:hypothetical protein